MFHFLIEKVSLLSKDAGRSLNDLLYPRYGGRETRSIKRIDRIRRRAKQIVCRHSRSELV